MASVPCQSLFNTPFLPVVKTNGECQKVQDLRAVNNAGVLTHPLVPILILVQILGNDKCLTVLDLKDAFFCIPIHPAFQLSVCLQMD